MTHTPSFSVRTSGYPSLPPPLLVSNSSNTSLPDVPPDDRQLPFFATPSADAKPALWSRLTKGWRHIILHSWLNILIFLIPIAYILDETMEEPEVWVFSFSLLGLVPLMRLHELTTQELTSRLGGATSGLINASMANVVEIVVAATALRKCELRVVQSTLIGSMLSKILLVLGICLFAGGIRFSEQVLEQTANSMNISLLSISVGAFLLPAAYHFTLSESENSVISASQKQSILHMSHSVSIVLIFIYIASLVFQLWSHNHLYHDAHYKNRKHHKAVLRSPMSFFRRGAQDKDGGTQMPYLSPSPPKRYAGGLRDIPLNERYPFTSPEIGFKSSSTIASSRSEVDVNGPPPFSVRLVDGQCGHPMTRGSSSRNFSGDTYHGSPETSRDDFFEGKQADERAACVPAISPEESTISLFLALLLLAIVTVGVGCTADMIVESMNDVSTTISKRWVGLILLPAVSSLAECATAINTSYKDKLSFSISVAVGSTIQTALFVTPFMVIIAWIADKPLALLFDPFESLVLYISVQTMNYVISDGKSNWLEGLILISLYIIIGVSFWFYPGSNVSSSLAECIPTPSGSVL